MAAYKKIPYGISNFHDLIAQHYYYVDKTKYIEVLENFNARDASASHSSYPCCATITTKPKPTSSIISSKSYTSARTRRP